MKSKNICDAQLLMAFLEHEQNKISNAICCGHDFSEEVDVQKRLFSSSFQLVVPPEDAESCGKIMPDSTEEDKIGTRKTSLLEPKNHESSPEADKGKQDIKVDYVLIDQILARFGIPSGCRLELLATVDEKGHVSLNEVKDVLNNIQDSTNKTVSGAEITPLLQKALFRFSPSSETLPVSTYQNYDLRQFRRLLERILESSQRYASPGQAHGENSKDHSKSLNDLFRTEENTERVLESALPSSFKDNDDRKNVWSIPLGNSKSQYGDSLDSVFLAYPAHKSIHLKEFLGSDVESVYVEDVFLGDAGGRSVEGGYDDAVSYKRVEEGGKDGLGKAAAEVSGQSIRDREMEEGGRCGNAFSRIESPIDARGDTIVASSGFSKVNANGFFLGCRGPEGRSDISKVPTQSSTHRDRNEGIKDKRISLALVSKSTSKSRAGKSPRKKEYSPYGGVSTHHPPSPRMSGVLDRSFFLLSSSWKKEFSRYLKQMSHRKQLVMKLHPENLGTLTLRMRSEKDSVIAKITTESESVKQLLLQNASILQRQMEEQGLVLSEFTVEVKHQMNSEPQENKRIAFSRRDREKASNVKYSQRNSHVWVYSSRSRDLLVNLVV